MGKRSITASSFSTQLFETELPTCMTDSLNGAFPQFTQSFNSSSPITAFCDNRLVTHCTVCVCSCFRALPRRGFDNTTQRRHR